MISEETKQAMMLSLLGLDRNVEKRKDFMSMVGKVCIVRTYSAGVHYGEVVYQNSKEVLLKDARRVHYWDGACSLSQLANEGSKCIETCRIAQTVPEILLTEAIEFIPMSAKAISNLGSNTWEK